MRVDERVCHLFECKPGSSARLDRAATSRICFASATRRPPPSSPTESAVSGTRGGRAGAVDGAVGLHPAGHVFPDSCSTTARGVGACCEWPFSREPLSPPLPPRPRPRGLPQWACECPVRASKRCCCGRSSLPSSARWRFPPASSRCSATRALSTSLIRGSTFGLPGTWGASPRRLVCAQISVGFRGVEPLRWLPSWVL